MQRFFMLHSFQQCRKEVTREDFPGESNERLRLLVGGSRVFVSLL